MYSIISFMFSDEYLYKFLLVNHSNGDKFLGLMEQHKDNQLFYWFKMIKIKCDNLLPVSSFGDSQNHLQDQINLI